MRGSHTFDILAATLDDIHSVYRIRGKVVRTTTDSGSNLIKAFKVSGEQSMETLVGQADTDTEEPAEEVEYQGTFSILEEDNGLEVQLPQHQRCVCHLLNLFATTDSALAKD